MAALSRESNPEQRVLIYHPDRCTGCRYCEVICSFLHFGAINFQKSHIHAFFDQERREFENRVCFHCENPVCAASCPVEAITKAEDTGWVKINPMKCVGCKNCVYACPLSIPWFDENHKVSAKCDFCDPVRKGKPACAEFCSPRALEVVPREVAWAHNRKLYLQGGK